MSLPDLKALKKLTAACRKVGITTFKCDAFEFTLGDAPEAPKPKTSLAAQGSSTSDDIETDELTDEQRLFWSAQGDVGMEDAKQ